MGLYYDDAIEHQMTDIVKKAINRAGGRKQLSEKMQLDYDIICDLADRRAYMLTIPTFEQRFGVQLKRSEDKQVEQKATPKQLREVNVDIRCPGFQEMKNLIEKTGRKVRIVYAG